jgi:SPP1 gp7 family putative phage head morphogenesis protein
LNAEPHIQALTHLYAQPCPCANEHPCAHTHAPPIAPKGDNELIADSYENGTGGVNDRLPQRYAGGFDKAVNTVFGGGRQHPELADNPRVNASRFGTYKTYDLCQKLEAARQSMSKYEFAKFAKARIGVYNGYQQTEYNTLVARSRTAKQWERFKEEKFLYPNIEWLRTASANPRPEHLAFEGLVLPQDDPFWQRNQPGNEYNCKCDWRTTDKPAPTGASPADITPAKGLDGNPAETGELVTERHPYFDRNANAPGWVGDKAVLRLPDEVAFVEKTTPTGQKYREHRLVDKAGEAAGNREIAALLLENGYKDVRLLPIIDKNQLLLRERYYGKNFPSKSKCPDAAIGNVMVEFKHSNNSNLSVNIGKAAQKSNIALVKLKTPVSDVHIEDVVRRQWEMSNRSNLEKIIIINNGKTQVFDRPQ